MSETRIMTQKPRFAQKSKICRKSTSLPLAACVTGDNSPAAYARKLFKPSKDSWSLVVCTEKKNLLRFAFGVFGGCRQGWGMFYFFLFFYHVIAQTMSRNCSSNFVWIQGCNMSLQRPRSTSWRFWCQSCGRKTPNLV